PADGRGRAGPRSAPRRAGSGAVLGAGRRPRRSGDFAGDIGARDHRWTAGGGVRPPGRRGARAWESGLPRDPGVARRRTGRRFSRFAVFGGDAQTAPRAGAAVMRFFSSMRFSFAVARRDRVETRASPREGEALG